MNFYEKLKKTSEKWNCLSKSDVLGSFDYMTLTISLDALYKDDFDRLGQLLSENNYKDEMSNQNLSYELYEHLKKIYGLSFHEYTHYIDSTATVWGVSFLKSLNEAYMTNHDMFETKESEYYKAKRFYDTARSFKLPAYFTAITPDVDFSQPWKYQVTAGYKYDSKGNITDIPIPFLSFENQKGERIVRSPISLIAILEASAMAQEFLYKSSLVNALPEDDRYVEQALLQREGLDFIYNHQLTEYTACAHLVANIQECKDVFKAYTICEKVATVVLNFTDESFENISFSATAKSTLEMDTNPQYAEAIKNSMKYKDRGFLFYIITMLMPKRDYDKDEDVILGVSSALNELGLEFYKLIMSARREVDILSNDLKKSKFIGLSQLADSAIKNFDQKLLSTQGMYSFAHFDLPPVLLGDCEIVHASPGVDNSLKDFDVERSYEELVIGLLWVERFSEACA
jgi:hypothetical protein